MTQPQTDYELTHQRRLFQVKIAFLVAGTAAGRYEVADRASPQDQVIAGSPTEGDDRAGRHVGGAEQIGAAAKDKGLHAELSGRVHGCDQRLGVPGLGKQVCRAADLVGRVRAHRLLPTHLETEGRQLLRQ